MTDYRKIAVFDSGVGSLSVIKELKNYLPNEDILYFADRANFPYGKKSNDELYEIVLKSVKFLERYDPKLIVVASNTPSITILKKIKQKCNIPLIGISLPLNILVKKSKTKKIGIMGTESTVKSLELSYQIKKKIPYYFEITKINASPIIELVENGMFLDSQVIFEKIIVNTLDNHIMNKKVDVISLSSTHLPLVKNIFEKLYPNVTFIDPSKYFVKKINHCLLTKDLQNSAENKGKLNIIVSKGKLEFSKIIKMLGVMHDVDRIESASFF